MAEQTASPNLPAEVTKVVDAFLGRWRFETKVQIPGAAAPFFAWVDFEFKQAAGGRAVAGTGIGKTSDGNRAEEAVLVSYDPSQITYGQLLKVFFSVAHDPTELNRQGPDRGTQYRSAIFYANEEQKRIAEAYIKQLDRAKVFDQPIVTQVAPLQAFHDAEAYHQDYLAHHPDEPYIVINDMPKVENLKKQLPNLYREK